MSTFPSFDITLNVYLFMLIVVLAMAPGFIRRSVQLARKQRRISALEQEMVEAHAELLEKEREYCELEARMRDITNPVIPINASKLEERSRQG
jgi:hypothetical protein